MLRKVTINPALNGWIVEVECQTLVFNDTDRLLHQLKEYLNNPEETEKCYMENSLNSDKVFELTVGDVPPMFDGEVATDSQAEARILTGEELREVFSPH